MNSKIFSAFSSPITHEACVDQENLETFSELAQDFNYATIPDGYEALFALRDLFEAGTDKRKAIDILIAEEEGAKKDMPTDI
jgi:hypothetical protein